MNAEPAVGDVISLHPAVLARYEQQLVHLQDALSKGVNAGDSEAAEAIRDLVETVTVFRNPSHPGGVTVEIVGRLNALLGEQAYPHNVRGVWGKMVAGDRVGQESRQQPIALPAIIDLGAWRQSSFVP